MQDGHLVVLAGRPSMGKTTLADAISVSAARYFADTDAHKAVVEFELEMSHQEMSLRRLSVITGIEIERIKRGRLDQGEWLSLNEAQAQLDRLPLLTDDTPKLGMAEIRSRARRIARHHGLGLVMLDHIGLIRPQRHAQGNRTAEITEITGDLKALAKELGVPVLALSQLSRDLERREDKRPNLSDLRDSGSIEQDADIVLFVYREEYYLSRSKPEKRPGEKDEPYFARVNDWHERSDRARNAADVIVAKHRNGPIGTVHAFFDGARGVFQNLSQAEMPL